MILVAVIGLVGVVGAAAIASWTQLYLRRHLGKTNGSGPLAAMVERSIVQQAEDRTENRLLFRTLFDHLHVEPPAGLLVDAVAVGGSHDHPDLEDAH